MSNNKLIISDPSLRDGNHAVAHQITQLQIETYCRKADEAGIHIIEVGHGNGLGASSIQVGIAAIDDKTLLETARKNITRSKLGVHVIPGVATIKRDLLPAIDIGVDVFRIASHCSEADLTQNHIDFCRKHQKEVYGCLMMSHMITPEALLEQAQKMEIYGAHGVLIMDSAGVYLPQDVHKRIKLLVEGLNIPVGFHGHNNFGMAITNTMEAYYSGATILDGTILGFGAGAGNTQLEVLISIFKKLDIETGIDFMKVLNLAELSKDFLVLKNPFINAENIVTGMAGVFSGLTITIKKIALEFNIDFLDLIIEIGKRKVIAGQEDVIYDIALELASKKLTNLL
ncbi:MAG: 4-hydroxy-2-oxovalerate aldolase [Alphaproteobacteria bacterium]|nr:4-hydroxy-2-oxovalerate aldolase [Alphaproteobacteria bacterium]